MEEYNCSVVCDYLTNPYILPNPAITMSLARSASAAGKISLPQSYCCDTRCRHRFVENLMKQSLSRRSSFSFGSKIRRPETFSFFYQGRILPFLYLPMTYILSSRAKA